MHTILWNNCLLIRITLSYVLFPFLRSKIACQPGMDLSRHHIRLIGYLMQPPLLITIIEQLLIG